MFKCPNCGAEKEERGRSCPACGHASDAGATSAPPGGGSGAADTAPASPDETLRPGSVVGGRYRLTGLLGRGAMGEVYRAEDLKLGQAVALKFLPPAVGGNPAAMQRLISEMRLGRQVSHPNVCRLHDLVELEGRQALSMEFIEGEDLASRLARAGPMSPGEVTRLATELCAGLAAAHDRGVVHRDLKPANVLLDREGRAHVADFGIAELAADAGPREYAGTLAYMAPELLAGGAATVRSDLYALALVLYEAATGRRRFPARSLGELQVQQAGAGELPREAVRNLPTRVRRLLTACLRREPGERPASAKAAAAMLGAEALLPRPRQLALAATLLLALLGAFGWLGWKRGWIVAGPQLSSNARLGPASAAVLPFANLSGEKRDEFFSDGMSDTLLDRLAQVPQLRIAARTSSFAFKGRNADAAEIGAALGVATIVEGSVQRQDETLRITAELVRVADGSRLWSKQYDRKSADLFAIQDEIAAAVSAALVGHLLPAGKAALARRGTRNLAAYEDYVKGHQALAHVSLNSMKAAEKFFASAIARDPDYVPAMLDLVQAWGWLMEFEEISSEQFQLRAAAMLDRVEAIEPGNPRVLSLRAWLAQERGDHGLAEKLVRRAISAAPGDFGIRMNASGVFWTAGKLPEALMQLDQMVAISPLDPYGYAHRAALLVALKRWPEAEASARHALALEPGDQVATITIAQIASHGGDPASAMLWQLRAYRYHADHLNAAFVALALDGLGEREAARAWMAESQRLRPKGNLYPGVFELEEAFLRGDDKGALAAGERLVAIIDDEGSLWLYDRLDTACAAADRLGRLDDFRARMSARGFLPSGLTQAAVQEWHGPKSERAKVDALGSMGDCIFGRDGADRRVAFEFLIVGTVGEHWQRDAQYRDWLPFLRGDTEGMIAALLKSDYHARTFAIEARRDRVERDPRIVARMQELLAREALARVKLEQAAVTQKVSLLPPPAARN